MSDQILARACQYGPELYVVLEAMLAEHIKYHPGRSCTCPHWKPARDLIAKVEEYGRNAHAGVWISKETADQISKDGP